VKVSNGNKMLRGEKVPFSEKRGTQGVSCEGGLLLAYRRKRRLARKRGLCRKKIEANSTQSAPHEHKT